MHFLAQCTAIFSKGRARQPCLQHVSTMVLLQPGQTVPWSPDLARALRPRRLGTSWELGTWIQVSTHGRHQIKSMALESAGNEFKV